MRQLAKAALLALFISTAYAADKSKFGELPPPPDPPKNYQSPPPPTGQPAVDEAIPEPEVVITTKGEERHEEYRIGGRLYMIKVTPRNGRPYYLVDREGRGDFSRSDLEPAESPPMWVIKRF
jgi:hypothetical protein